jgi:membrane-associated protease RseP (regulator of RpoE activity)
MDEVFARALPRPRVPALNLGLFLATIGTTLFMGAVYAGAPWALSGSGVRAMAQAAARVVSAGLPFAGALIAILLSHEMGHYLLARRHRVDATLPFFIPFPGGFGTLGAVIRIRSPMPSRRATLQIGAAGPLAGFAVALPLLLWGFAHSPVVPDLTHADGLFSPLGWVLSAMGLLPAAVEHQGAFIIGDSLVTRAATWLAHGRLPPGTTLALHPVALAAWLGCYITALNLIPQGQLDGGHVSYALLGRERARRVSAVASAALLVLGLTASWMWACWWLVTRFVVGMRHPPALAEEPLSRGGRALAVGALVLFVLTFVPLPLS